MKNNFIIACIVLLVAACTPPQYVAKKEEDLTQKGARQPKTEVRKRPKNIILMIGDGMGLTQISAGLYMNGNKLNLEQFPFIGLHKSYPAENGDLITDSAAGATAFSCGEKTYNAAIGVGADSLPRTTILELAQRRGMATGLIATSNIQHATPASFVAHVKKRDMYEEISTWFVKNQVDIFVGGGKKYFERRKMDDRNILKELETNGYYVTDWTKEDLERMIFPNKKIAYLTANEQPLSAEQGRDYLPLASNLACNFLSKRSDKGFFMMIEGSQIDWGGHAKNSDYIIAEMIDFDTAIGQVLDFAQKDGNTLVIVTADHETGGYAIQKGSKMGKVKGEFTSDYHTGCLIPVFAFGPGAEQFAGIYENTAIFHKMKKLLGL